MSGSVVRTALLLAATLATVCASPTFAGDKHDRRAERRAFEQGLIAYRRGRLDVAIPALEAGTNWNPLFAHYYLARIYSDNSRAFTNHGRAYRLFSGIVDRFYNIDPNDFRRAPTVAKSITAMARYVQTGLPEIALPADPAYAVQLYKYAAEYYNDADAQFQLAKLKLYGDGVAEDIRTARYWLMRLVRRGHPSAEAFVADLLWRGRFFERDREAARRLIVRARRDAPLYELIWIDDIFQVIYCGSSHRDRAQLADMFSMWPGDLGRRSERQRLDWLSGPVRTCADGQPIRLPGSLRDSNGGWTRNQAEGDAEAQMRSVESRQVKPRSAPKPEMMLGLSGADGDTSEESR